MKYECPRLSLLIITPIPKANTIGPKSCDVIPCFARLLPSLDVVAVSQAPSPESNPNSPSPVTTMVGPYPTIES
ncbi:unnamed protein product [Musa banksii]